jgi:ribose-phosphate pyrophosphokinase
VATGSGVEFGFMEKRRSAGVVSGTHFAGEVEGRSVFIVDDMICGGGTTLRAAVAVRDRGAAEVHALATHGLLTPETVDRLGATATLDSVTLTDSAAPFAVSTVALGKKLRVIGCASLIAGAIRALHEDTDPGDLPTPQVTIVDGSQ